MGNDSLGCGWVQLNPVTMGCALVELVVERRQFVLFVFVSVVHWFEGIRWRVRLTHADFHTNIFVLVFFICIKVEFLFWYL